MLLSRPRNSINNHHGHGRFSYGVLVYVFTTGCATNKIWLFKIYFLKLSYLYESLGVSIWNKKIGHSFQASFLAPLLQNWMFKKLTYKKKDLEKQIEQHCLLA